MKTLYGVPSPLRTSQGSHNNELLKLLTSIFCLVKFSLILLSLLIHQGSYTRFQKTLLMTSCLQILVKISSGSPLAIINWDPSC